MSKAQLPLLTSIMMVVQAFLSAPAGLRAKRSIADRNQVRPCSAWVLFSFVKGQDDRIKLMSHLRPLCKLCPASAGHSLV